MVTGIALKNESNAAGISARRWRAPLFLLCLACVLVRLSFMFVVPMSGAPDEVSHHYIVSFITEHHRLPCLQDIASGGPAAVYGSLPVLGYLPHLLFASLFSDHVLIYERFGSLLAGVLLIVAAWGVGGELFPDKPRLQLALPAVIAFHPQLAFVQSYVNNDATAGTVAAFALWLVLRMIRSGPSFRSSVGVGLLIGWLILCKYSGAALAPALVAGILHACLIHGKPLRETVAALTSAVLAAAAVCAPFFLRNYVQFAGDLLGTNTMYHFWAIAYHKPLAYHLPFLQIATSLRWWRMMFFSFWGLFGYMDLYLWRPVYFVYLGFAVAAALGCIKALRSVTLSDGKGRVSTWALLFAVVLANLAAMLWASTTNLGGPQGRYLFCSELALVALFVAGLHRLGGDKLVIALIGFSVVVCGGAWLMLFKLYKSGAGLLF